MVEVHVHRRAWGKSRPGECIATGPSGELGNPEKFAFINYYLRRSQSFFASLISPLAFVDFRECDHSYYKNSYVTWTPGILSRHLANGCVLKCSCIGLMVFRSLSCLGIIICYINTI